MRSYKKCIVLYIIILIFLNSCLNKPFRKINFSRGNNKMYFYSTIGFDTSFKKTNDFQNKYRNFYIDNDTVLKILKKDLIFEKVLNKETSNSNYLIRLKNNNNIIDGCVLDVENRVIIYGNNKLRFELIDFKKLQNRFKKLNAFEVTCKRVSDADHFINFVYNSSGFLYNSYKKTDNFYNGFNGKVVVYTNKSNLNYTKDWKAMLSPIESDFKEIGDIQITGLSFEAKDSVAITMLWRNDYSNKLPQKYKIISNYTDSMEIQLYVYDIEKEKIIDFFKSKNINNFEIKDMN